METSTKYNRADIAQRIVATIASKWQIDEKEVATRFDPLLMMLVEVLAKELALINSQWERSAEEITESVIERFFPKYPIRANLPHIAIIQAQPLEAAAVLPAFYDFQLPVEDHTVHFTPIHDTRIYNIKQHSIWVNNAPFAAGTPAMHAPKAIHSIGLLCQRHAEVENLDGLQIHIATSISSQSATLLYALQHGSCSINGVPTDMVLGYKNQGTEQPPFWNALQQLTLEIHKASFITLVQKDTIQTLPQDHPLWQKINDKEMDSSSIVYIEWTLPILLQERWIHQLSIYTNAFVGINREQRTLHHKLDEYVNTVPLPIDQHLLFIAKVAGDAGENYAVSEATAENNLQQGHYMLKGSNVGKMSSNALRHNIEDLKEQVNSSNAFFSNTSNDYIGRHLQEMQRIIYRLQDKLQNAKALKQQMQYLFVKPFSTDKNLSINFWTFDNRKLDKIRPDTLLECKGSLLKKDSPRLLTKPYPLATAYTNSWGQPLRQILSKRDVTELAINVFGSYFDTLEILHQYQATSDVHQGKRITIVLNIRLKAGYDMDFAALDNNRIKYEMDHNSILSYPFSINIILPTA